MRTEQEYTLKNDTERQLALIGGSLLTLLAVRQRSWPALMLGTVGAGLLVRGLTGESLLHKIGLDGNARELLPEPLQTPGLQVKETLTINCPPARAYQFWRNLENLPRFMNFLESVQAGEDGRSHWIVKAPPGITLTWDAEIVADEPDKLIRWQTLPSTTAVQHSGEVRFKSAPAGRGTEVTADLRYEPPGGVVGEAFGYLTNGVTEQLIREQVRRFKAVLETGEVPTIDGQPSGRQ